MTHDTEPGYLADQLNTESTDTEQSVLTAWNAVAEAWVDAVRQGRLESREAVTNPAIVNTILSLAPGTGLDIGCGEGYYTQRLQQQKPEYAITGLDISRDAIKEACRRTKDIRWLVASGARPPVSGRSIKTIISLFTPLMPQGLDHALADDGEIITVNTGPQHLMQLREVIYDEVKAESFSPVAKMADARFIAVDEQKLTYEVTVPGGDPLVALFNMTPHRWKVSPERAEKLQTIDSLTLEIDVVLHRFRRQKDS